MRRKFSVEQRRLFAHIEFIMEVENNPFGDVLILVITEDPHNFGACF